ncbi:E3 ubiquitin-protein ligase RNF13 [Nymphon striatum]|nr:E3 ubiquitin-protein ligase RNF13 [Nymphon striatum]
MFPYRRMPWPVTALYVFAVVNMLTLFSITIVHADVIVLNSKNVTKDVFSDYPAEFSPVLSAKGIQGKLVRAFPYDDACSSLGPPPTNDSDYFVLVKRYGCSFATKAVNAEIGGYKAVIVYNVETKESSSSNGTSVSINIPTVLVDQTVGVYLDDHYLYDKGYQIVITSSPPFNLNNYLFPFAVIIAVCFMIMCIFSIVKCYRDRRRDRANRLPTKQLKKIPIKKFQKSDGYDVCAICIDDYKEGEKLRILPCSHAYHAKCVDPWLTNNKRTCPVCKRKVFIDTDEADSEDDSEPEPSGSTESTPLLSSNQSRGNTNYGFNRSLLSRAEEATHSEAGTQSEPAENSVQPSTSTPDQDDAVAIISPVHSVNNNDDLDSVAVAGVSNSSQESRRKNRSEFVV